MSTGGDDMNRKQAELLLAAVILTRSTAYLFSKAGLEHLAAFNLLAVRFLTAFILLGVIFIKRLRHIKAAEVRAGAVIGALFTAVMGLEMAALKTTDTSTVSFLENTAIVIVPLLEAALARRLPKASSLAGAALALLGVALITLSSGAFSFTAGELCCLGAATLYACAIIVTDRLSHRGDALMIGIMQVGFIGLFSLLLSIIFEQPRLPSGGVEWGAILMLALVCTGFGFTLQPVAQAHTTSQRAGLMCALNPAFASVLGVIVLSEPITVQGVCGSLLILASLYVPHIAAAVKKRRAAS